MNTKHVLVYSYLLCALSSVQGMDSDVYNIDFEHTTHSSNDNDVVSSYEHDAYTIDSEDTYSDDDSDLQTPITQDIDLLYREIINNNQISTLAILEKLIAINNAYPTGHNNSIFVPHNIILKAAVIADNRDLASILFMNGATADTKEETLLSHARSPEMIDILIHNGANPCHASAPLIELTKNSSAKIILHLLHKCPKLKPNAKDDLGNTSLHHAALSGNFYKILALRIHKANIARRNNNQKTPYNLFMENMNRDKALTVFEGKPWKQTKNQILAQKALRGKLSIQQISSYKYKISMHQ